MLTILPDFCLYNKSYFGTTKIIMRRENQPVDRLHREGICAEDSE